MTYYVAFLEGFRPVVKNKIRQQSFFFQSPIWHTYWPYIAEQPCQILCKSVDVIKSYDVMKSGNPHSFSSITRDCHLRFQWNSICMFMFTLSIHYPTPPKKKSEKFQCFLLFFCLVQRIAKIFKNCFLTIKDKNIEDIKQIYTINHEH